MADTNAYHGEPIRVTISFSFSKCIGKSVVIGFTVSQPEFIGLAFSQPERECFTQRFSLAQRERESVNVMRDAVTDSDR